MASAKLHNSFRKYHRWLGFFLAGIIAVYATSGILLIFRKTDVLKYENITEQHLAAGLNAQELAKAVSLKNFSVLSDTPEAMTFAQGSYNKKTGLTIITKKDYPLVLAKLVNLHKATTSSPLFFMNITFGLCLLFFVISAFSMFMTKALVYKNGLKIAVGGFLFAVLMVIFGS